MSALKKQPSYYDFSTGSVIFQKLVVVLFLYWLDGESEIIFNLVIRLITGGP